MGARGGGDAFVRHKRRGDGVGRRLARLVLEPCDRPPRRRRPARRAGRGLERPADRAGAGGLQRRDGRGARGVRFARRLDQVPPYLFAELERKIAAKSREGIDVISLGIGDPDLPTPQAIVDAAAEAMHNPSTHQYPGNHGTDEFRETVAGFYRDRFGVELDPAGEVVPALGGKEAVGHIAMALLDPGDFALSPEPGYPPYTSGPVFSGAEIHYLPLTEENAFFPDLYGVPDEAAERPNPLYLNSPNNPTGAVVPDGAFGDAVAFARRHELIVVHDN